MHYLFAYSGRPQWKLSVLSSVSPHRASNWPSQRNWFSRKYTFGPPLVSLQDLVTIHPTFTATFRVAVTTLVHSVVTFCPFANSSCLFARFLFLLQRSCCYPRRTSTTSNHKTSSSCCVASREWETQRRIERNTDTTRAASRQRLARWPAAKRRDADVDVDLKHDRVNDSRRDWPEARALLATLVVVDTCESTRVNALFN